MTCVDARLNHKYDIRGDAVLSTMVNALKTLTVY